MDFEQPLQLGHFQKRYKRFFADIEYEGQTLTAHCPNTGSLMGLQEPGAPCLFSTSADPNRKLPHTLQMVKSGDTWVGVNTGLPNKLVHELFLQGGMPHWQGYDRAQLEVKISESSRIDLVLWADKDHPNLAKWPANQLKKPAHLIEVKNVTLAENGVALFPDAVTSRGVKHLEELIAYKKRGFGAEMVFVVQREDCQTFSPAEAIDPEYAEHLREAHRQGVQITALPCSLSPERVSLKTSPLKLEL